MKKFKELLFLKNLKGVGKKAIYTIYWNALESYDDIDELVKFVVEKSKLSYDLILKAKSTADIMYTEITNDLDIHVLTVFDDDYPDSLHVMGNKKPLILYVKGNIEALKMDNIAVIGTRKPSNWTVIIEQRLVSRILAISNRAIISGLALGCDKIAHETTIKERKVTIAVMPCGVNVIAPQQNKALASNIITTGGCLISEYEPNVKPLKAYYIERDAIVAALSDITLVVECGEKSGTMHTVKKAYEYKKIIGCYFPVDMNKGLYSGNEYMVNELNAAKIMGIKELEELLSIKSGYLNNCLKYEKNI